jgi:hypothetical protein
MRVSRNSQMATPVIALCGILTSSLFATEFYVETAAQFNAAIDRNSRSFATLHSGDRVYLKGGTWCGLVCTLTGSMSDAEAQSDPAQIIACDASWNPAPGAVTVTGLSQIQLSGAGILVLGLKFTSQSGMKKAGSSVTYEDDNLAYLFWCKANSRYMTLSHIEFDRCGWDNSDTANNDHYGPWILMYGYHHRIRYCSFTGRDFDIVNTSLATSRSIRNATIFFKKDNSEGSTEARGHLVERCYFGQRLCPKSGDSRLQDSSTDNGWETIRVGDSGTQDTIMAVTIRQCTFYHSIYAVDGGANDKPGDYEIVSVKSRGNKILCNTFLNSYGQLTFRHGDYNTAHANLFLGGGARYDAGGSIELGGEPANSVMAGVRSIGFGNTISNNHFYKLNGTGFTAALCMVRGTTNTSSSGTLANGNAGSGYETCNFTQVFHNTFVDCKEVKLDHQDDGTEPVWATHFFNNLAVWNTGVSSNGIKGQDTTALSSRGGAAAGNWIWATASSQFGSATSLLGSGSNTISTSASKNPQITSLLDGVAIIGPGSPALNQAATLPQIIDSSTTASAFNLPANVAALSALDFRGFARPVSGRDPGNYELASVGSGYAPLKRQEVGIVAAAYAYDLVQWRKQFFGTPENSGSASNDSDPNNNGLINLIEYALGLDPLRSGSPALPAQCLIDGRLTITFSIAARSDITYVVEAAGSIAGPWSQIWQHVGSTTESGLVTVQDSVSLAASTTRFLRLRVTTP